MPKHWSKTEQKYVINPKLDQFLHKVVQVCNEYGYTIEHEDSHGGFIISRGRDHSWIMEAMDNTHEKKEKKK